MAAVPDTYEETLLEVAHDLDMSPELLRAAFKSYISVDDASLQDHVEAACYAIYRITKLKSACRMTRKSRTAWRARAMELGSPGHLR